MDPFWKRKVMTNEAYCLNPPQLTSWNQQLHKKQKRDYTSWTGTWLGPLFSILTHCLCSCKGGTCGKRKRNMVSGATTHERRETSCQMPLRRKINLLSHSFIHSPLTNLSCYFINISLEPIIYVLALFLVLEITMNQQLLLELTC